jgi:Mrp family chromosome partitioning ATPase
MDAPAIHSNAAPAGGEQVSRNYELLMQTGTTGIFQLPGTLPLAATPTVDQETTGAQSLRPEIGALVDRLFRLPETESPRAVIFCAVEPVSEAQLTVAQVAEAVADLGLGSVCLVDAHPGAPTLHERYQLENSFGFSDCLQAGKSLQEAARPVHGSRLHLIPAGARGDAWSSTAVNDLSSWVLALRNSFDYVLVYGPPLSLNLHSCLLGRHLDGLVMLIEANRTRKDTVSALKQTITDSTVRLLGAILNNRRYPIPEAIYRRLP